MNVFSFVLLIIILLLQFLGPIWMKAEIERGVQAKYDRLLEEYRYDIKVRERAERVAEYLVLANDLHSDVDYRRANQLSWELAMWLPEDVYKKMTAAIVKPNEKTNPLSVVIDVRNLLLKKDAGSLTQDDLAFHAPGIGKHEGKKSK